METTNEITTAGAASVLNDGLGRLLPCPFCGGAPEVLCKGNDYSATRRVTIKCKQCRTERTDAAMRNDMKWLKRVASDRWNMRSNAE